MLAELIHKFVLWLMLGIGTAGFLAMGMDKLPAVSGSRRIRERTLLLVALAGGFLGVWAGMFVFRHKIRKEGFVKVLLVITTLWSFIWLFTP